MGVQTDGGSVFFVGQAGKAEPPVNDVWTVPGEEARLAEWQAEDRASDHDPMSYYHGLQDQDFLEAILENREPAVTGAEGRKLVELIQALYLSGREHRPVRFPLG